MTTLSELTTSQLHHIISIKEQIEKLQGQIDLIASRGGGNGDFPLSFAVTTRRKRRMSAAARAKIAAAARARWARVRAGNAKSAPKKRRKMSAAARAKIAAAAKARWAKAKAAGKKRL